MPVTATDFDMIIVGGGLVGNCLALALKDSGLKIAIIEANTLEHLANSALGDRALALSAGTVAALERLTIWQDIANKATAITDIHVSDRGHFGKARLSARKETVNALGYVIIARDIEIHAATLVERGGGGITRFSPARIIGLSSGTQAIHASVKYQEKNIILSAKILIGADGGNSSVRTLLDIGQQISDYGQTAVVTTVKTSLPHVNKAYERFTESGPLALLPLGKNHCAVVWTRKNQDAEKLMSLTDEEFLGQLQKCFGYWLGRLTLCAPKRAFPVSLIRTESMHSGRALIVGNAAHQLHPVAGQGFNLGLRDVLVLAEMLREQISSGQDIGAQDFLSRYAQARRQDHDQTIRFTDGLVRLFSNDSLIFSGARNAGLTIFDHIPAAKTFLSQHAMGLAQRLTNKVSGRHASR